MPELPDITLYVEHLERRVAGATLVRVRVVSPNLLMTVDPPLEAVEGRQVTAVRRMGKRIVFVLDGDLYLVLHLMVAGRLQWKDPGAKVPGRVGLAAFEFTTGSLILTEASTRRRATMHVVAGRRALARLDPGGLEPLDAETAAFAERLRSEDHTLKRSLTDPRLFSGIGNAYSDEILHRAQLSPMQHSVNLDDAEVARLHDAVRRVLIEWTERLRTETGEAFPTHVTAFRKDMAVHGKYKQPCPVCGSPVQRIVYAENETNYCARCQTGGRLLADRALSRLLRKDWPKTLEEMET